MNEDVSPIKNADVLLSCEFSFSGVQSHPIKQLPNLVVSGRCVSTFPFGDQTSAWCFFKPGSPAISLFWGGGGFGGVGLVFYEKTTNELFGRRDLQG